MINFDSCTHQKQPVGETSTQLHKAPPPGREDSLSFLSFARGLCRTLACSRLLLWCGLLEALFQRREDIDHLSAAAVRCWLRDRNLLTFHFLVNHRQIPLAVFVVVLLRLEFRR